MRELNQRGVKVWDTLQISPIGTQYMSFSTQPERGEPEPRMLGHGFLFHAALEIDSLFPINTGFFLAPGFYYSNCCFSLSLRYKSRQNSEITVLTTSRPRLPSFPPTKLESCVSCRYSMYMLCLRSWNHPVPWIGPLIYHQS